MNQKEVYINIMLSRYLNKTQVTKTPGKEVCACVFVQIIQFAHKFMEKR